MSNPPSSLRILLSESAAPAVVLAAGALAEALRTETLRPSRTVAVGSLTAEDRRFEGLTLLTDPAQVSAIALERNEDLSEAAPQGEGDRIVIRHLRVPVGLCVLAWGSSPAAAQRALAIIGEYLGLRVFPWGRVVVASHDERDLVSADVVLQARFPVRGLAPVRMDDRATWHAGDLETYADFAAWNGYNLVAWPCRIGTPAIPVRAGLARYEGATSTGCAVGCKDNCADALAAFRRRGLQAAVMFDPLRLPPSILDAAPAADLQPGGLGIQPFSETGQLLYRHLVAAIQGAHQPDALVLAMSELPWRPGSRPEPGQSPDALAFHAQLLGVYGPDAVDPETELYLQAAAALAQAARYLELDLPVILMGRHLAGLTSQQHQVLPENCSLCPMPAGDLVSLADQLTRDAARGVPVLFDHLQSNHRSVYGALTVDETYLGDSPRVRSLDTILSAWLRAPMQGIVLRHSRLHGCDENLLYTAQAVWGEIPSARLFYAELSSALYGAAAETMARARQGQEEIEAVSSVHDMGMAAHAPSTGGSSAETWPVAESENEEDDDTLPSSAQLAQSPPHEPPATRSLRHIVADLLDRMPLAVEALPDETYLLSFLRDLSSRNVRLAGILQAVEGSLARRDLLSAEQVARIERAAGRLTAKLEMGRFARAVMSAALLCRQAADPDVGGNAFGATAPIGGLTALHQALTALRKSPPQRILDVLKHEHTCDREATGAVVEATLVEPWQQLVDRLARLLGPQVARRQTLGQAGQELLDPRISRRE